MSTPKSQSTKPAHTPTPWTVAECADTHTVDGPDGVWLATLEHGDTKANAEFIVRACNSHDDLVAALKAYVAACEQQDIKLGPITGDAKAALAKAEAR